MQTAVSVIGVPSQVILVGSNRAPVAPVIGPNTAAPTMRPITVPSLGATL